MLIFEAKAELQERIDLINSEKYPTGDYLQALEIAVKCLDAQQRVCDLLNDFWCDVKDTDTFSANLVYDIISSLHMS